MVHRVDTFRTVRGIVDLPSLKVSHPSNIPNRFYQAPKLKNWMCELRTFSQIWSHMYGFHKLTEVLNRCRHL